jgi:isopenicillin-N N-acyltransferase-like protein
MNIEVDECSSIAALPESTVNRSTLLAQNWDWHKDLESCQVILKIAGRNTIPPFITFTEAGQVAKIGMNGSGIGLAVNNLSADHVQIGVPWIFVARRILESTHLTQAMAYALSTPRAHSMNFLIVHAAGEAVDIETSPAENHILFPHGNTLAHTNHYLRPCLRFKDKKSQDSNPSTYIRYHRIQKQLKSMDKNIDIEGIQEILKDHFDHPFSVCFHDIQGILPGSIALKTCLSILMDLSAKRILYTQGNPCQNKIETLDLSSFL